MRNVALKLLAVAVTAASTTAPASAQEAGQVQAGAAVVDSAYHVGNSAGQYSTTRVTEPGHHGDSLGDKDPHLQQVKNQASYGMHSRPSVRALVVKGADGRYVALLSTDHYIPQDALHRRTAQLVEQRTKGAIKASNLTMAVSHNHSSPSYSSINWGVWAFQDVFDFRFFAYYADRQAEAIVQAAEKLHDVRMSATTSYFDNFHKNPMGPGVGDDHTPVGFPRLYTDHDLSVIRFENVDDPGNPRPLATLVNIGEHPEFLPGLELITSEYVGTMQRMVDRAAGGVTLFTQNATGTSEIEEEYSHPIEQRQAFNHAGYAQMSWAAKQLADAVVGNVRDIERQQVTADPDPSHDPGRLYGGTPYADRFIRWTSSFPVAMESRWFPGPVSHPYPGVSSCRTDAALALNPRVPIIGLPDCTEVPAGASLMPVVGQVAPSSPGITTDTFTRLGIPLPSNYSVPSTVALQDTTGAHLQAIRLGDILLTVCSCEQWAEQSFNVKTRTDTRPGNEYLGYDPTAPDADPANRCVQNGDGTYEADGSGTGTWTCTPGGKHVDRLVQRLRSRVLNDATGWDDPTCDEMGCGLRGESEPADLPEIRGNFTHDDTDVRGGSVQSEEFAAARGYRMVVPISMANDYNGYIASYRDYMQRDHYRKALTAFGAHSMDYLSTRMVRLGHALKGDPAARRAIDREAVVEKAAPEYAALAAKTAADQAHADVKARAVGEAADAGVRAYDPTVPDDGGSESDMRQPRDIERFDAATFTWVGGNNYSDSPVVVVERKEGDKWVRFADSTGEVPVNVQYPGTDATSLLTYRLGGQVWRWTATFEAFVSRFGLVDPQGGTYRATPAGSYRFIVEGRWRRGGADRPYTRVSRVFEVAPWRGITVEGLALDAERRVAFTAGPRSTTSEVRVRGTSRRDFGRLTFEIGPVDYPDHVKDQAATGFRFLTKQRNYSTEALPDGKPDLARAQHYCQDCRFGDWLDASGRLTATITYVSLTGTRTTEAVTSTDGTFRGTRPVAAGERAEVVIEDEWGNSSGAPRTVLGAAAAVRQLLGLR